MNQLFQGLLALGISILVLVGLFELYENVESSTKAQNEQQIVTTLFSDMQNTFALSPAGAGSVTNATAAAMSVFPSSYTYGNNGFTANDGETFSVAGNAGTNTYTLKASNLNGTTCHTLAETFNNETQSEDVAGTTFTNSKGSWSPSTPNGAGCAATGNTITWTQAVG
jgi:hypothetical protein